MAYEVEQRARVNSEEFERVRKFLDENAKFIGKKEMKSFLFRKPDYLRIRLIKGENFAIITCKEGSYEDKARKETEFEISLKKLENFVNEKKEEGYKECSFVHTKRFSYEFKEIKVELNEIDFLGMIVEVEGIAENESEIDLLNAKVNSVFSILKLEKLSPNVYQGMIDKTYKENTKRVEEQDFSV